MSTHTRVARFTHRGAVAALGMAAVLAAGCGQPEDPAAGGGSTPPTTPTPTVTSDAAPTPTAATEPATPSEVPTASATTDAPTPTPAPSDEPSQALPAGTIVAATSDGIMLTSPDGSTSRVAGIDGKVRKAFADGRGGIIFQRNDKGIGVVRDGDVTTLVALSEFAPTEFSTDEGETTTMPPVALRLWDVDTAAGQIAFQVEFEPDDIVYERTVEFRVNLDGEGSRDVPDSATDFPPEHPPVEVFASWETGVQVSIAGDTTVRSWAVEATSGIDLVVGGQVQDLPWPGARASDGDGRLILSAQVADDAATVAVVRHAPGALELVEVDLESGKKVTTAKAHGSMLTCFDGTTVLAHDPHEDVTTIQDLDSGDTTQVDGWATIVG